MAKRTAWSKADRSNPKKNKSLAIRNVLTKSPGAKAAEVVATVKREYGHDVAQNMVYMVKTKANMAADGRPRRTTASRTDGSPTTAAEWVDAIKIARQLLKAAGSLANASALLKAVEI